MHELSITQSIVESVTDHARGRKVSRVTLEIGTCAGVMIDAVRFCFDLAAEGSPLEGATLEIREIEARAHCRVCGEEFVKAALYTPCPCGANDFRLICGDELAIKQYELA